MNQKQRQLFERAYYSMSRSIYWYIYKKVSKEEYAEDITAETFMKLAENLDILIERDENGVKAWLYTVARNKVVDYYRKQGRSAKRVEIDEEVFEIIAKEEGEYLEEAIREHDSKVLLDALAQLSPVEKELISLRFHDDLQFSEIAQVLDKNEGAVKMTLYRALEKLKLIIDKEGEHNI